MFLIANPTALWVQVLRSKYNCGDLKIPKVKKKANNACIWQAIVNIWEDMSQGIQWSIGNGRGACFGPDPWLASGVVLKD